MPSSVPGLRAVAPRPHPPVEAAPAVPASALGLPAIVQSDDYRCGPATVLSVLRYAGYLPRADVRTVARHLGTTRDGTDESMMVAYLNRFPGLTAQAARVTYEQLVQRARARQLTIVCYEAYPQGRVPRRPDGAIDWPRVRNSGHYSAVV